MKISVKNMVCERCKMILSAELEEKGFSIKELSLGEIHFENNVSNDMNQIREILVNNGFELVEKPNEILVAEIKKQLIISLEDMKLRPKLSEFLASGLNRDYSILSKLFRAHEGITIEKYLIRLKIEKVKELIQMNTKTFSEIAFELDYAHSSHLARQFKTITGMSMSDYQKARDWNRKALDQII